MTDTLSDIFAALASPERWANAEKSWRRTEKTLTGYTAHKFKTYSVARTYEQTRLDDRDKVAWDMRRCGKVLEFAREKTTGKMHLVSGYFCDHRLCPLCSFKRSVKNFLQIEKVITQPDFRKKRWVFLTFTVRNCSGAELSDTIDRLHNAFRKMTASTTTIFRQRFLGWYRCTEITYNASENTYHPHIHVLACVDQYYFSKKNDKYMTLDELEALWKKFLNKATRKEYRAELMRGGHRGQHLGIRRYRSAGKYPPVNYTPSCKIEAVKDGLRGVAEVAKYTLKDADYINRPDVLEVLTRALEGKRCTAFGGLMRTVHQRLGLTDAEDDILDDTPDLREAYRSDPAFALYILNWNAGAKCYDIVKREADDGDGAGRKTITLTDEALKFGFG